MAFKGTTRVGTTDAAAEAPLTEAEKAAEERAIRCVDACRVDEVFADNSKFLEPEALLHLVRALTSAGGPSRGNAPESHPGTPRGAARTRRRWPS